MANRDKIINFVNGYLRIRDIKDPARNGLQVEGKDEVKKIAFGVSASLEFFKRAASARADMAAVHHGLLWDKPYTVKGPFKERLKLLLENDITLAAWHLPLDRHPVVGNNARIMKMLGAARLKPFGVYEGQTIGFKGVFAKPRPLAEIKRALRDGLGSACLSFEFGPEKIKTLAVVSGGAQSMFAQAVEAGLDLYITGEASEFVQETARESGTNFVAAGHYNTEKAGVLALEKLLRARFKIKTGFIDVPNPV